MVALLGSPHLEFLRNSQASWKYFEESTGEWNGAIEIPSRSWEDSDSRFEGEERAMFLDIIRKMLHWIPEKRPTAKELLEHPWLH